METNVSIVETDLALLRPMATVYICGNVADVVTTTRTGCAPVVRRWTAVEHLDLRTGEITMDDSRAATRADDMYSVRCSINRLVRIVNTNFTGARNEIFVTLTYRACMSDSGQLQQDMQAFMRRIRAQIPTGVEYIYVAEPQQRGAWHAHALIKRVDGENLYISQAKLRSAWGRGGARVNRLADIDNLGVYIATYLADLNGKKGARLPLYPAGLRIYRTSRGIVPPQRIDCVSGAQAHAIAQEHTGTRAACYDRAYDVYITDGEPCADGGTPIAPTVRVRRTQYKRTK